MHKPVVPGRPAADQPTLIITDYYPIAGPFSGSCGGFAVIE
ncbi:MAG TPA: hypothetical protein VN750_00055 [Steroidobacteraceae bacterium]|nr:hypothetical protein [Steroidobacteraceae bacterium]